MGTRPYTVRSTQPHGNQEGSPLMFARLSRNAVCLSACILLAGGTGLGKHGAARSLAAAAEAGTGQTDAERMSADKAALAPLQAFVGGWRGVGQVRRGSSQGAWTENADWIWKFADGRAAIVFESPNGKYYRSGRLTPGKQAGTFELSASVPAASADEQSGGDASDDGKPGDQPAEPRVDRFVGKLDKNHQLVLVNQRAEPAGSADSVARVSIRTVADGDRLIVLYEKRLPGQDRFARLAEVGYTRKGVAFAAGSGQPECVVTGGLGTIEVEHAGKKYYVCCTGCRDLFQDDPEGVLADYRERKSKGRKSRIRD